jgi:hypothetical protein
LVRVWGYRYVKWTGAQEFNRRRCASRRC